MAEPNVMDPKLAETVTAQHDERDQPALRALVGRFIQKYFSAYGLYTARLMEVDGKRPVCVIQYEDGDTEEMHLDQIQRLLMPQSWRPPALEDAAAITNSRYGLTWPPPTASSKMVVQGKRQRKPSERALQHQLFQHAMEWSKAEPAPVRRKPKKQSKSTSNTTAASGPAKITKASNSATHNATSSTAVVLQSSSGTVAKPLPKRAKPAKANPCPSPNGLVFHDHGTVSIRGGQFLQDGSRASFTVATASQKQRVHVILPFPVPLEARKDGLAEAKILLESYLSAGHALVPVVDLSKDLPPAPLPPSQTIATPSSTRTPSTATVAVDDDGCDSSDNDDNRSAAPRRAWTMCASCARKHWNDTACPVLADAVGNDVVSSEPHFFGDKRWGGATTTSMLESLKRRCALLPDQGAEDATEMKEDLTEAGIVTEVYRIVNAKLDVTCGADGRYGITGNVTKGSMTRMLKFLRQECELDEESMLIDLGHGMGRPNLHAAALVPPIKASIGTEFNPQLYKQSMLALAELVQVCPQLARRPSVLFMDQNIKDLHSFNPFTHIYAFNIGMPDDLIHHILALVRKSKAVKYLIIYPHREASHATLSRMGKVVKHMSMSMPGGRSYEALIVKIDHSDTDLIEHTDQDVANALEVLESPRLYRAYIHQLGTVIDLDSEEQQVRYTRSHRHNTINRYFLEQSPCLPDIPLGLLRRVALALGVGSTGYKVDLLANIQAYVPDTFGISMFAVGKTFSERTLQAIMTKLLSKPPARRQPEMSF
eukprot:m.165793 g.165793  ORF g.165793 m.165793 type:complete len:768 (+) comp16605_c0_seq2:52-2355(+)